MIIIDLATVSYTKGLTPAQGAGQNNMAAKVLSRLANYKYIHKSNTHGMHVTIQKQHKLQLFVY